MAGFVLSHEAEFDLMDIWDYIEDETKNALVADKFLIYVYGLLENLASSPVIGRTRSDLRKGLRSFPFPKHSYIIYYTIREKDIYINRILHGNRDQQRQFR